jgi:hypothetical protein
MGTMSSSALRPGATLADRYRLEQVLGQVDARTAWRATDGLLNRLVVVHTLPVEHPAADQMLRAARAVAQLADPRFLRVLDASATTEIVYVVAEWLAGVDLASLVADGPLPTSEAAHVATEVASGLAAAHAVGLHHLRLRPSRVLRADNGQVKIVGLGVDAVLDDGNGAVSARPVDGATAAQARAWEQELAREDARGCGAVLYAALTGRWPLPRRDTLLPAPEVDGRVCAPRQVRAGISTELDDIAARALGIGRRTDDELRTPGEVAAALRSATATTPSWPASVVAPVPADVGAEHAVLAAPAQPSAVSRLALVSVGTVLTVGVALAGWQLGLAAQDRDANGARPSTPATSAPGSEPTPSGAPVPIAAVTAFDPQGDDGGENDDRLPAAVDGDPSTAWRTSTYLQQLGPDGLKTGVGLVLDLGRPQLVSTVTLELEGRGTSLELAVTDELPRRRPDATTVATSPDTGPLVTLRPESPVEARYLLVWLTRLPELGPEEFRGGITEITVRG